jgi:hypothetical protein
LSIESPLPAELPALGEVVRRLVGSSALRQIGNASLELTVRVLSFSYRDGLPGDDSGHGGGWVFDCRFLPNPGREERFASMTGRDEAVAAYLEAEPTVGAFLERVRTLVDKAVDNYRGRNFTDLSVAFGCTGGRHRSVFCAERLAEHLRRRGGRGVAVRDGGIVKGWCSRGNMRLLTIASETLIEIGGPLLELVLDRLMYGVDSVVINVHHHDRSRPLDEPHQILVALRGSLSLTPVGLGGSLSRARSPFSTT